MNISYYITRQYGNICRSSVTMQTRLSVKADRSMCVF